MSATGAALQGYREPVLLVSVLVACRAPLPAELEFGFEAPPVAPGLGVGYTDQLVAVPEGMIVVGAATTLFLEGEHARVLPFFGYLVRDAGGGVLELESPEGSTGYDYRKMTWVAAPLPEARTSGPRLEGDTLVLPTATGEQRLPLALPEGAQARVAEAQGDTIRVVVSPRWTNGVLGISHRDAPTLLVAIGGAPPREQWRATLPDRDDELFGGAGDVRTIDGTTWAVVNRGLVSVGPDRVEAHPELGRVDALAVDAAGRLWAGGASVWRLDPAGWTQVLSAWEAPAVPPERLVQFTGSPLRHGSARPAMNAAMLVDGGAVCGDPTDADRFLSVWGSCDAWLGLTLSGMVWMGNPDGRVRGDPPVGEVYAVDESSGTLFVAGAEGVAWTRWHDPASRAPQKAPLEWKLAWPHPAEMVAGYQGILGVSVWFASRDSVCHTDGDAPVCFPVKGVTGLTAGRAGAWVVADGEVRPVTVERGLGDPLHHEPGGWFRSAAYDPARGQLWAWGGDTHLHAIDPENRTYRTYPAVGISRAAVAGDSLVIVGIPGLPHCAAQVR